MVWFGLGNLDGVRLIEINGLDGWIGMNRLDYSGISSSRINANG